MLRSALHCPASQVLAVMAVLAAEGDHATLNGVAAGLAPGVLTDVVIANLDHLPRREDVAAQGGGGVPSPSGGMAALARPHAGMRMETLRSALPCPWFARSHACRCAVEEGVWRALPGSG